MSEYEVKNAIMGAEPVAADEPREFFLLADRVLVEPFEDTLERAEGKIQLLAALERPKEGRVLLAGPGTYQNGEFIPVQVRIGDVVLFGQHAGQKVKWQGRDVLMFREGDFFGFWR